ncbi:hypothetical protein ACJ6WF_16995 [Streptomyces sp. MMS24-I2-30]|uniref:hypothetical protein n=1 Tax=Streptomyces sp. MMS24-I2-30 TaxID=3351564 RepID=UPI003896B750
MAAADRRRHVTGMLLAHASPDLVGGVLRLTFRNAQLAVAWRESGAQAALEGAMQHHEIDASVEVVGPQTRPVSAAP